MTAMSKRGRVALKFLPLVLVPAAFLAAAPWLKAVDRNLFSVASTSTVLFVMVYATYLSIYVQRGQDEVQRAGAQFSAEWGALGGTIVFAVLLSLPPFRYFATVTLWDWAGYPDPAAGRKVVVLAMTFAFCAVVLLQTLGRLVVNVAWWKRLDR